MVVFEGLDDDDDDEKEEEEDGYEEEEEDDDGDDDDDYVDDDNDEDGYMAFIWWCNEVINYEGNKSYYDGLISSYVRYIVSRT